MYFYKILEEALYKKVSCIFLVNLKSKQFESKDILKFLELLLFHNHNFKKKSISN